MPKERPPGKQLPPDYQPPKSVPYRVKGPVTVNPADPNKDRDTWISVARQHNLDAKELIKFNFHTNNTDEVNWYLRRNTGCKVETPDHLNWMFSSSASPGIIYLPIDRSNMEEVVITEKVTTDPFALEFEGPSEPWDWIQKSFDGFTLVDTGMAIFMVEFGGVVILAAGIVVTAASALVVLGVVTETALNKLREQEMAEGLSLGIVLAADGRSLRWIDDHNFVKKWPVDQTRVNIYYPEYGKQLQGIYNTSLVAGIAHGKQFNTVATKNLFVFIKSQMSESAKEEYSGDLKNWGTRKWEYFYLLCAAILRRRITFN